MKNKSLIMLSLSLWLMSALPAHADDDYDDYDNYETSQVVISATRTEAFIEDVPTTMDVITSEELERIGATNLIEVFSTQFGIQTDGMKGSVPSIRGMNIGYTVILIDGRKPARLESTQDGMAPLLALIGISNIERIEIIRGQASAMYGADAMAGVINIITKKSALGEDSGVFTLSGGNKEIVTGLTYDFGKMGNWDSMFSTTLRKGLGMATKNYQADGYSYGGLGTELSLSTNTGYHFNDDNELRFNFSYLDQQSISKSTAGVVSAGNRKWWYNGAIEYYGKTEDHTFNFIPFFTQGNLKNAAGTTFYHFTDYGFNSQDSWALNDWNLITYGIEYKRSELSHSTSQLAGMNADPMDRFSFFAQDEIMLFDDRVILLPSVRYDHDSYFGGEIIPRLGATWEFIPKHRFKVNVGTSYLAPTLVQLGGVEGQGDELWSGATNASLYTNTITTEKITQYVEGNPDLKPQTSFGWEIRYEGAYKNFSGSLGYYQTKTENAIASDAGLVEDGYLDDPGTYYIIKQRYNLKGTTTYQGVELELKYDFAKYFSLTGGYMWMDNYGYDKLRVSGYATHTYTAGLAFFHPEWNVSANLYGKYFLDFVSTGATNGATQSDPYDYFNMNFALSKTWKDKYTLTASVINLFQSERDGINNWSNPEYSLTFQVRF